MTNYIIGVIILTPFNGDTKMIEWMKEFYMVGVMCGGVSLLFTIVGGWVLMKGLESLKGELDEQSTTPSVSEDDETEDLPRV